MIFSYQNAFKKCKIQPHTIARTRTNPFSRRTNKKKSIQAFKCFNFTLFDFREVGSAHIAPHIFIPVTEQTFNCPEQWRTNQKQPTKANIFEKLKLGPVRVKSAGPTNFWLKFFSGWRTNWNNHGTIKEQWKAAI